MSHNHSFLISRGMTLASPPLLVTIPVSNMILRVPKRLSNTIYFLCILFLKLYSIVKEANLDNQLNTLRT